MKFSRKVGNGSVNKLLNFGGDPITDPDTDLGPYRDTGKTCLGGGMHLSTWPLSVVVIILSVGAQFSQ